MDKDFVEWSDIDLEDLLGKYTDIELVEDTSSDDDVPDGPAQKQKEKVKLATSRTYVCPLCEKPYKSISGFRGHTVRIHNRNDIRGA